ncbi:hypothetical protein ACHAP6_001902 [Verticillium nonalfalfae]
MGDLPMTGMPSGFSKSIMAAAPYESRPPSPPYIHVPLTTLREMTLDPFLGNLATLGITAAEYSIITNNGTPQQASDPSEEWTYESRREAQAVVDWLYLGPHSASRDQAFLEREGITMILAVGYASDITKPTTLVTLGPTAATRALGIMMDRVDVKSMHNLTRVYTTAAKKINDHILEVHRSQADSGAVVSHRRGKVLVVCESGNDRSAMVVTAYLMVMFGLDLITTVSYVTMKRFSAMYDEDSKRLLVAWHDILAAQRSVTAQVMASTACKDARSEPRKRGIEMMFDGHQCGGSGQDERMDRNDDESRFGNRNFVPFMDTGN